MKLAPVTLDAGSQLIQLLLHFFTTGIFPLIILDLSRLFLDPGHRHHVSVCALDNFRYFFIHPGSEPALDTVFFFEDGSSSCRPPLSYVDQHATVGHVQGKKVAEIGIPADTPQPVPAEQVISVAPRFGGMGQLCPLVGAQYMNKWDPVDTVTWELAMSQGGGDFVFTQEPRLPWFASGSEEGELPTCRLWRGMR
jgi:hypothetical protein